MTHIETMPGCCCGTADPCWDEDACFDAHHGWDGLAGPDGVCFGMGGTRMEVIGEAVAHLCEYRPDQVRTVIDVLMRDGEAAVPQEERDALMALAGILNSGLALMR